jgi:hypothetical protein
MGHVAHLVDIRYAYKISVRRLEWKRQLVRPRKRRKDNIKMDLK